MSEQTPLDLPLPSGDSLKEEPELESKLESSEDDCPIPRLTRSLSVQPHPANSSLSECFNDSTLESCYIHHGDCNIITLATHKGTSTRQCLRSYKYFCPGCTAGSRGIYSQCEYCDYDTV